MGPSLRRWWRGRRPVKAHQLRGLPFAAPFLSPPHAPAQAISAPGDGSFQVVSFATQDGRYDAELASLEKNCRELQIPFSGILLPPVGREDACLFKPSFIKYELYRWRRAVIWVDADGRFFEPPRLPAVAWDLGLIRNDKAREDNEFAACCIALNHTPRCLAFLDIWAKLCELRIPDFGLDHYRMNCAIAAYRRHLRIADLQQSRSGFFVRDAHNAKQRIF